MIISGHFSYQRPKTVEEAGRFLEQNADSLMIAGGTDLIPLIKYDLKQPKHLVALDDIEYLKRMEWRNNELHIGAMTSLASLSEASIIEEHYTVLAKTSRLVASPQIRNMGTIGGNICQDRRCIYFNQSHGWRQNIDPCFKTGGRICHQSPRSTSCRAIYHSDLAPVLLALGARVEYFFKGQFLTISIGDYIRDHIIQNGAITNQKRILCGFILPKLPPDEWIGVTKRSLRESIDFPLFNAAMRWGTDELDHNGFRCVIIVGATSPEPFSLPQTQEQLIINVKARQINIDDLIESALVEIRQNSALILDSGVTVSSRKEAFKAIGPLIRKCVSVIPNKIFHKPNNTRTVL